MRLSFACFAVGSCAEVHFEADYHGIESCPLIRRTRFNLCLTEVSYQQQLNRPLYLNDATSLYSIEPLFFGIPPFSLCRHCNRLLCHLLLFWLHNLEKREGGRRNHDVRNPDLPPQSETRGFLDHDLWGLGWDCTGPHQSSPILILLSTFIYFIFLILSNYQPIHFITNISIAYYYLSTPTWLILHQAVIQF